MFAPTRIVSAMSCLLLAGVLASACSSASVRDEFGEDNPDGSAATNTSGGIGENDGGGLGEGANGPRIELKGTTYAPNGTLPLAGVLVYWTTQEPDEIPEGVYCDTCVELPEGTSTTSASDGSFTLSLPSGRELYVVTQKGQFRRVRKITFAEGDEEFDEETTTLPGRMDRADGDTIPKIAVMTEPSSTTFDMIQTALEGLGIEDWDNFNNSKSRLDDLDEYNIMMFPCGSSSPSAGELEKVREFTAKGGKVYASDYAHEWADEVFPEFFEGPMTEDGGESAPAGSFEDEGLANWLSAIGDDPSDATFEGVWSSFHGLQSAEVPTPENDGSVISVEPKVWTRVQDQSRYGSGEASVSFPYGCGRGMASIFHVHGRSPDDLLQQEKALLYMLLEVAACVSPGGEIH